MVRSNYGNRATDATEATVQPFRDSIVSVDLVALMGGDLRRVASTNGGEYAGPCPFCGGKDRFRVWPNHPSGKGRWWCRQCGRHGDAIDFLRQREGLSYREAVERLGLPSPAGPPLSPARQERPPEPPPLNVRWAMRAIAEESEALLWTPAGARAREWLAGRGLREETLKAWHIGYRSADRWMHGLRVPRGIVIPCLVNGEPWYLKVRRPVPPLTGPKYQMVRGGRPALYGLDYLTGKPVAVICEGELDALLLWQEAGDLADVVALGSATARPHPHFLTHLVTARRWLVATDRDRAGEQGAAWWEEFSRRVRRVRPLQGNDLTEFAQAGGDLRAWVEFRLAQERGAGVGDTSAPDPLVLYAVRELGAVCTTGDFEAQAEILLAQEEDSPAWRRRWATLAEAAGWPCNGATWQEWAGDMN